MNCQRRQNTPLPRCLRNTFVFVLLVVFFQTSSGVVQVSKSVKEKVSLPCGYNISHAELHRFRIYWQKEDEMVLSLIAEEKREYMNRALFGIDFSLIILDLHLSDRGKYTCIVQKNENGSYVVKNRHSVELSIRADFSVPNITPFGNPSADIKRIMCLASGGFPEPRLSWLENGKELSAIDTTISQDPQSELYSVSSKLDFNTTYNHSITCHVAYGDSQVSKNFTWEKPPEDPPDRKDSSVVSVILAVVIPILIIVVVIFVAVCSSVRTKDNLCNENPEPPQQRDQLLLH